MSIRKFIKIFIIVIILLTILGIYYVFNYYKKSKNLNNEIYNNKVTIFKEKYSYNKYYFEEIIKEVVKREVSWDMLPLTENFKKKFKDGIFDIDLGNSTNVDYVDWFPYTSDRNRCIMYLETWEKQSKVWQRKVHYTYNGKYELDDMEVLDKILIMDSNGYYPKYDVDYIYGNSDHENRMILIFLFNPFRKRKYDKFKTSKHFKEKFPEVEKNEPIKIDRPYLFIDNIEIVNDKFYIWVYDENNHYEYEIDILTDDTGAIDDVLYKYIKTYEGDTDNMEIFINKMEDSMSNE